MLLGIIVLVYGKVSFKAVNIIEVVYWVCFILGLEFVLSCYFLDEV